jgi:hypothetical protein
MTTTAALDCQSKPNQMTMIGATPMIGSAETMLPMGIRPRRRKSNRSARMAVTKPALQPITNPAITALKIVWLTSAHRIGSEPRMRVQMAEGGGKRMKGTPAPRTMASHRMRIHAPKMAGMAA